jgi:hypothetical protein
MPSSEPMCWQLSNSTGLQAQLGAFIRRRP